jgi:ribonuclease HI
VNRTNIKSQWVAGHEGIQGNESAHQFAKDAAVPENTEPLPSGEDRYTSLSHLQRSPTDAKCNRSDG